MSRVPTCDSMAHNATDTNQLARLQIRLLGPLSVERNGAPAELPQSKKARALLAILASSGREHRRQQLCDWLWPDVDDPRGALRGALTRLRPVVDEPARQRLIADTNTVRLDLTDSELDAQRLLDADLTTVETAELIALSALCRGHFLEDLELPDLLEYQAFCVAQRELIGRRQRAVLDTLIERHRSEPQRAIAFARTRAQLDPTDEAVQAAWIELLVDAGHTGEAQEQLRTHREWLERRGEKLGPRLQRVQHALRQPSAAAADLPPPAAPAIEQHIRFCTTRDNVRIAYATSGDGPPLLKTANWLNHLEHDWESPIWRHLLQALSREHRLVRYDERGNGLSDREPPELSLEAFVEDLETVAAAAGLARYPLLGISQGCPVAIMHALRHPERVTHLVLFNGYARGRRVRQSPQQVEEHEALTTLMKIGWGRSQPAFRQVFTSLFFPRIADSKMHAFNELQRHCATPEQAVRLMGAIGDLDVSHLLGQVTTPTLVISSRQDGLIPFEEGRLMAAGIPNARFVPLESENHLLTAEEPAFARLLAEFRAFLAGPSAPAA